MIQPAAAPFVNGRIAADALELMDVTGSGISRRLLEDAVGRRHRQDGVDGENDHRPPPRGDIIARAEPSAASDEAYFLAQLRAVVAAVETPLDRLLAKYRGRASGPAQFYAAHLDWDERRRTTAISGPAQGK